MKSEDRLIDCFSERTLESRLFVPDLTVWYEWHKHHGTLPPAWTESSLVEIAKILGVPVWLTAQPWRIETPGIDVEKVEGDREQAIHYHAPAGTLTARWTLGPDGDWWQSDYPVETAADLEAAVEIAESRQYVIEPDTLSALQNQVQDAGVVAIELPRRPYSELLHDFLGWSGGLLLLQEPRVDTIMASLEAKLRQLVDQLSQLPGRILLSPDNLDGQFISPEAFAKHLTESYVRTCAQIRARGKRLVVHVGGPIKSLLPSLASTGVDAIQGISGPPQSDATLLEARELVGPDMILWGGIPQDVLLNTYAREQFDAAVTRAAGESARLERVLLGVADRVPVHAEVDRLKAIPSLADPASKN